MSPTLPPPLVQPPPNTTNPPPYAPSAANILTITYATITYRRLLKYESYSLTANAKAHGGFVPGSGADYLELGPNKHTTHAQGVITATTVTEQRYDDVNFDDDDAREEGDLGYVSQTGYQHQHQHHSQVQGGGIGPGAGATVLSPQDLKKEVDRAMGVEFGWGSAPPADTTATTTHQTTTHDGIGYTGGHSHGGHAGESGLHHSGSVVLGGGMAAHSAAASVVEVERRESQAGVVGGVQRQGSVAGVVVVEGGVGAMGRVEEEGR